MSELHLLVPEPLARAASGGQYGYNAFNKSEPETPNTHLSHSARRTSNVTKPSVGIFPNESETSANCTHSTIDQRQNKPTTPPTTESGYTPVILY
mmetsp:Transcript_83683/g.122466  ORF Transcript_83683/g.122466 Transcript_83683/m.122466 type:complete len:95 (+) Transcript_83683:17-301(+)